MARFFYVVLAATFLGLLAHLLWPRSVPDPLTAAQLQSYMQYVERYTSYGHVTPPVVKFVGKSEFETVRNNDASYYPVPGGAYHEGGIWLDVTRIDLSDDLSRSNLIHLLVYHAQETSLKKFGPFVFKRDLYQRLGLDQRCKEPRVWEAYTLQNRWLHESTHRGYEVKQDIMYKMSRCELGP